MPLYKHCHINSLSELWVWHIVEDEQHLIQNGSLGSNCIKRLKEMTHTHQRKGFLAIRSLLAVANISIDDLRYSNTGKPYLFNGPYLSFSHTRDFAAIAIGTVPIGVDVERHRSKIKRIAKKFISPNDQAPSNTIAELTDLWCIKESTYKAVSIPGLQFNKDILVDLRMSNQEVVRCKDETYDIFRYVWSEHSCAVTVKNQT